jgi:multidrug efflux system membrane fusion protein
MKKRIAIGLAIPLILAVITVGCQKGGVAGQKTKDASPGKTEKASKRGADASAGQPRLAYPVEVQKVEERSWIYTADAVGSIEAFEKVQVTARVAGVVDRVRFAEGNQARVGQVLVEIEPERYKLAVEAAQASLEKANASLADAETGLKRREDVAKQTPGLIPEEELATWRTKVRLAASDVAQAKAALNQASLNLRDAYVKAPFSGIIQTRTVQTGQYVQPGTIMATLIRRDPLLLRFSVSERDAIRIQIGMEANFRVRGGDKVYKAKITHVEASADETTRMVPITAEIIDTNDPGLRPGAFAEVSIAVSSPRLAATVPQTAIRPSERGIIVYVVENDVARERIITGGMRTADGFVEVLSGLQPGEMLVIRGAEALRNGAPVRITQFGAEQASTEPSAPSEADPAPKKKAG